MMRPGLVVALLAALPATGTRAAETPLSGAEIAQLLPGIVALGEGTRQVFSATGATTYADPRGPTGGRWRVEGDHYCSQWPPADRWACYAVLRDDNRLIWVDDAGNRTVTTLTPRN